MLVSGAMVLNYIWIAFFLVGISVSGNIYLLIADGFLGAYTTFSTFMYEGFNLFQENEKKNAFFYIGGSLVIGIIGYIIGFELSTLLGSIK